MVPEKDVTFIKKYGESKMKRETIEEFILNMLCIQMSGTYLWRLLVDGGTEISEQNFYQLMTNYEYEGLIESFKVEKVTNGEVISETWFRRKV
jgi:hypothetical protein